MPITTLLAEVDFEGTRLHRLLKKSGKQIPRGLKPARDDKNKELSGTAEAVPFQCIAQKNTAHRDDLHVTTRALMSALLIAVTALLVSCSKKPKETEPVVTVQTAVAQRGTIQQVIGAEAILFPCDQAAITPKVVAPVRTFYVNRGSRVQRGQVLAVLENRDLAAAEVENKGSYEQAQAAYGLETTSALPEEWQKAELDRKTAKEEYDAAQKVYDSRRILFQQGAMPRKEVDSSAVALAQAKSQYEIAEQHLAALQLAGKQQQLKSAKGQLTSAQGKYEGAAAQLAYTEIRSPIDGVVTDRPTYPGETPAAGMPLLTVMDTSAVIARTHIP